MTILVIDGQGGGIGKRLVEELVKKAPAGVQIIAVGTNSVATSAMLRAGATAAATGENPVLVNCANAQVIAGPMGIALANAMYGEITPAMANAVGASSAQRVLIPVEKCNTHVAGVAQLPLAQYIEDAVQTILNIVAKG